MAFLFHGADLVGAFLSFEGAGGEEGVVGFRVGAWMGWERGLLDVGKWCVGLEGSRGRTGDEAAEESCCS